MILGVQGLPASHLTPSYILEAVIKKYFKTSNYSVHFWELFGVILKAKSEFLHLFVLFVFMPVFGIALGRLAATCLRISGSFQGPGWGHFGHFFADAAKLKKMGLFKRSA